MITVKEYAEQQGKSVQAVYKQMRAKENAALLENHIFLQKVGNKTAKVLDDEAVEILNNASRQAPTVVLQNGKDEQIEALKLEKEQLANENKALLVKVADLQERLLQEKDNVKLLQQEKIALLEEKQDDQNQQPDEKETFWSRLWHRN